MFWKQRHYTPATMATVTDGEVSYNIDYRSKNDDAWYTCGVVLKDGKLRVKYADFVQSEYDEVYSIDDFSNTDQIDEFICRFRPVSEPVEDVDCSSVKEGMLMCAAYKDDGSVRYFDAIVDAVVSVEHTPENCVCNYLLFWQHGPAAGNLTAIKLEDLCFIRHGDIDQIVDFTTLVKIKIITESTDDFLTPKSHFLPKLTSLKELGSVGQKSLIEFSQVKGRFCPQMIDQDKELGGFKETGCNHYIILENLEKDLCPTLIMQFIHEQTSITTQSYVFSSLLVETYARGVIAVDNLSKLKKIYEFINNPNHFIVSFSGRPWVIAEDALRVGTSNINLQSLQQKPEKINKGKELRVVRLGTEEYKKAKKAKELYLEFRNHINGLLQRLETEEKKNRHLFSAN